mmetsp:Transcript_2213/g.5238  ORF Transcript_2213/g.5238 Transcript_2213/m.5238 type:complete len:714 (+) Transcript_2213:284-2425(+)|eukprot:CAMPEP_0178985492 /NCGR_PEP_ID=MMETSP0795-20121207/2183_1 /TAXON_ID=88552 /ORGANISM="Amoebophrya sp., Strain Ameob2" /LENGTH=713 /DNA_ID=CAMNT_0020676457 /DNA_START=141 /DNA_END=2282 /DNA_ORIENTATION=+
MEGAASFIEVAKVKLIGEDLAIVANPSLGVDVHVALPKGVYLHLKPGDEVAYTPDPNDYTKAAPGAPAWRLLPGSADFNYSTNSAELTKFGSYIGTLAKYFGNQPNTTGRPDKLHGSGFLNCDELVEEGDIYIHASMLRGADLAQGAKLAFNLHHNANGKPQASAPLWAQVDDFGRGGGGAGISATTFAAVPAAAPAAAVSVNSKGKGGKAAKGGATASSSLFGTAAMNSIKASGAPPGGKGGFKKEEFVTVRKEDRDIARQELAEIEAIDRTLMQLGTITGQITPDGGHVVVHTVDQGSGQGMVFVENAILEKYRLGENKDIAFWTRENEDGHPLVDDGQPVWELTSSFRENQDVYFGEYFGKVINVSTLNNGFLQCDELKQQYNGRDPFCHKNIMTACDLQLGDVIAFRAHINDQQTPQVSAPCWRLCRDALERDACKAKIADFGPPAAARPEPVVNMHPSSAAAQGSLIGPPPGKGGGKAGNKQAGKGGKVGGAKGAGGSRQFNLKQQENLHVPAGGAAMEKFLSGGEDEYDALADADGWFLVGMKAGNNTGDSLLADMPHEGFLSNTNRQGNGFIKCVDFPNQDVFVHSSVLATCQLKLQDEVRFRVHINSSGMPQLSAPCWRKPAGGELSHQEMGVAITRAANAGATAPVPKPFLNGGSGGAGGGAAGKNKTGAPKGGKGFFGGKGGTIRAQNKGTGGAGGGERPGPY